MNVVNVYKTGYVMLLRDVIEEHYVKATFSSNNYFVYVNMTSSYLSFHSYSTC